MKKFIAGFVLGGLLFGGVTALAAQKITVTFFDGAVMVDGQKATVLAKNKPLVFQGYTYFPSYMLADLGYKPSRSADGKTVTLETIGETYYASRTFDTNYSVPANTVTNQNATTDIMYDTPLKIKGPDDKVYSNYIYVKVEKTADSRAQSEMEFTLGERFRQFKTEIGIVAHRLENKTSEPITVKVFTTDKAGQTKLYSTHTLEKGKATVKLTMPLRYVEKLTLSVAGNGEETGEVLMMDPVFIK